MLSLFIIKVHVYAQAWSTSCAPRCPRYAFLYVGFSYNPAVFFTDVMWIQDTTGAGPTLNVTVPAISSGVAVWAHAGRGDMLNSSTVVDSFFYRNIGLRLCEGEEDTAAQLVARPRGDVVMLAESRPLPGCAENGVFSPAGPRCFGGDCSPVSYVCDDIGRVVGNYNTATDGSLCVGGVVSSWPSATCPNNKCYHSNAAYEAGQAWACLASTTATATATASSTASLTRAATKTATSTSTTSSSYAPASAAAPVFSVLGGRFTSPSLVSLTLRSSTPGAFIYASVYGNPSLHYLDFFWIEDATGVSGPTLTLQVPYIGGGASICAIAGRGGLANSSQVCETYSYTNNTWCSGTLGGCSSPAGVHLIVI